MFEFSTFLKVRIGIFVFGFLRLFQLISTKSDYSLMFFLYLFSMLILIFVRTLGQTESVDVEDSVVDDKQAPDLTCTESESQMLQGVIANVLR